MKNTNGKIIDNIAFLAMEDYLFDSLSDVVPKHLLEDMKQFEDPADEGFLVIAAVTRDEEIPVGAMVAYLDDLSGEISIESIFVLPDFRRRGIGTGLIDRLQIGAAQAFIPDAIGGLTLEEQSGSEITIYYSLSDIENKAFEKFLKHVGFAGFEDLLPMIKVSRDTLKNSKVFSEAFKEDFSEREMVSDGSLRAGFFTGEFFHENYWEQICMSANAELSREYSWFYGTITGVLGSVILEERDDNSFFITDMNIGDDMPQRTALKLLLNVINKLYLERGEFTLLFDMGEDENFLYSQLESLADEVLTCKTAYKEIEYKEIS